MFDSCCRQIAALESTITTMHQYLQDTEFASQNLFRLATNEARQLVSLDERLQSKEHELTILERDFHTSDLNDDFAEPYVMAAFARAAEACQAVRRLKDDVASLRASLANHQHSVQAIAGAILQIAKQGISTVYGGISAAPSGRTLGTLSIRDVILQARNQSMHYEEKGHKQPVLALFSTLEKEHGSQFSLAKHPKQSRAKQILELLGWNDYGLYLLDMNVLLPCAT